MRFMQAAIATLDERYARNDQQEDGGRAEGRGRREGGGGGYSPDASVGARPVARLRERGYSPPTSASLHPPAPSPLRGGRREEAWGRLVVVLLVTEVLRPNTAVKHRRVIVTAGREG